MNQPDSLAVSPPLEVSVPDDIPTSPVGVTVDSPIHNIDAPYELEEAFRSEEVSIPATIDSGAITVPYFQTYQPEVLTPEVNADTIEAGEPLFGILLSPPPPFEEPQKIENDSAGVSFILTGLFLLFFIIGIRFRNTRKYVGALIRNMVEVRLRQNVFDETVRETSFLMLLNVLWCASAGIILYYLIDFHVVNNPFGSYPFTSSPGAGMGICMVVSIAYTLFMAVSYRIIGQVFTDKGHAILWVRGFAATQGLLGFIYFPLALLFISWPENTLFLLWVSLITFVLAKIVFLWKGMRIFFTRFSSWVLFLYYLCSLEIVPLILAYLAAILLCGVV